MPTLADALAQATRYWDTKRNASIMAMRAGTCAAILGKGRKAEGLTRSDAITVLEGLRKRGLSQGSQGSYYAAFRRMLALSGIATTDWPSGPTAPRRVREALTEEGINKLAYCLSQGDHHLLPNPTLDLLTVLRATGMRVDVEALSFDAWKVLPERKLWVVGKGGHERTIPLRVDDWEFLLNKPRMDAMRRLSYSAHLKRWKKAADRAGITSRLPTPHAIRHYYATQAYARTKDLRVVQELLGHADINTTARYIGVDMEELRRAVTA